MEWSIVDIARIAGTTSRTLRHYGEVGLLEPTRIGRNGYRYYNEDALVRLQRILLLRELGLGIPAIVEVMRGERDSVDALTIHLGLLEQQKQRLDRQIASVEQTVRKMKGGQQLMPEEMFDGFDHTAYKEEVETTWGVDAYRQGDRWWRSKSAQEQSAYRAQHKAIAADYQAARDHKEPADGAVVQAIVARHVDWLNLTAEITGGEITAQRRRCYGDMYVGDPRFAANYGGLDGAEFVREAFGYYAEHTLA
jgi:MerR family transcriptional regulator, thiopeptide resistance regulator